MQPESIFCEASFNKHVDIILLFFDHPPTPTSVDTFYEVNVDKKGEV